jgi:hypothetical protein
LIFNGLRIVYFRSCRGAREDIEHQLVDEYDELQDAIGPKPKRIAKVPKRPMKDAEARTPLDPGAPAPHFQGVLADRGPEQVKAALEAWTARVEGVPIVDIAHGLGVSIALAKQLIKEVHEAIRDDLKDNLELNRQLDLERVDGLINTFYPVARAGDTDSAAVVIRALQHRSKLTGIEPLPDPGRDHPINVLTWINGQMPSIARLVDSLPMELPPSAPS